MTIATAQPAITITQSAAAMTRARLKVAYLTTKYPAVSHTFIRRELLELERRGHQILRLAIRSAGGPTPDPQDQLEEQRTLHILSQPKAQLIAATVRAIISSPIAFGRAVCTCFALATRSDRGALRHAAYLVEAAFLRQVVRREGVQHIHVHFGTNAAAVALLLRRMGGPTYSLAIHGPDEFDAPIGLSLADKVQGAEFVAAISDYSAAQVCRWVPFSVWPRVHVIRCTVGPAFFDAATPVSPQSRTLLCIGRFNAQKGHLQLVEAFARLIASGADARLVLAGDGELRSEIEKRVAAHGLESRVEITGWIPEEEVRRRIRECRCVVLASFAEGLPMVLMEAFALGRVAIATCIAGIPELVRPGINGWLVTAGNAQMLADAMREVLSTPATKLDAMAAEGREAVLARHNTPVEAERLEALLVRAIQH